MAGVGRVHKDLRRRDAVQILPERGDGQRDEAMQRAAVRVVNRWWEELMSDQISFLLRVGGVKT